MARIARTAVGYRIRYRNIMGECRMKQNMYFVEITDTYGGEANYSWVTRHCVTASSVRGAMWKVSRDSGISWHCVDDYGDMARYDSKSGATCAFITEWDNDTHNQYLRINKI